MIVEGLFVYLPTIIAITLAFFVGVGVGLSLCGIFLGSGAGLLYKFPSLREKFANYLINKESSIHPKQ
jgi:hypothetical protein